MENPVWIVLMMGLVCWGSVTGMTLGNSLTPPSSTEISLGDSATVLSSIENGTSLFNSSQSKVMDNATYWEQRQALMEEDYSSRIGSSLILTLEEEVVNKLLVESLSAEMGAAQATLNFPPAINFMLSKPDIELSQVFSIIKSMPKGAVLHAHDSALTSIDYVIEELTYWDDLFMCYDTGGQLVFRFSSSYPELPCSGMWTLVRDERASYDTPEQFDALLYKQLTIITDDPQGAYPDVNAVWTRFQQYFITISGIFEYRAAFEAYLTQGLAEFVMDGVAYLEFRGTLPLLYEADGRVLDSFETMQVYQDTVDQFMLGHSEDFYGVRFIYGPPRGVTEETVYQYVSLAGDLIGRHPALVAGLDLVGQEDLGPPLKYFLAPLLTVSDQNISIPVFYHAGETDWYGEDSDENILDALLLNATRIGHGYAISHHPALVRRARDSDTPIEVCPISNQVLKLVDDLRNHPAVGLTASGFPLVVSSDDPAAWGALPLSHDFYEAFMAFGGGRADLKLLKQFALNSIKYSSLDDGQQQELQALWQRQWDSFINNITQKLVENKIVN